MPGSRAPWGTITRDQVVTTATDMVKAGGFQAMTIRSLAAELGVAPMSLYSHVRDKDDILDEVVDRLLAGAWRPSVSEDDWEEWIMQAADKLRRFLVAQPAALYVYLRHPVVSPAAVARMDAMMAVLRKALPDEEPAKRAYAIIHTYTVGFAAMEAGRAGWTPADAESSGLAVELAAYTTPQQFAYGLGHLVKGFGHAAPTTS
jgi:TetR/AcrR family transcriptional regulator, tetracycline repressor protein